MSTDKTDLGLFHQLAAAISDRSAVDWDEAERAAADKDQEMVRQLKALDRVAAAYRSTELDEDPTPESMAMGPTPPARPAPVSRDLQGEGRWGHLEIIERIGVGSFGEVYRARDPKLDREVALKLLWPEESETERASDLIQEGRLLARVHHENVVRVYGADRFEGRVGIWMEFIRGRNLEDHLREQGRLGASEASAIGRHLCRALAAVHRAGVLHRDVKTTNVMREEGGRIVLMDFGTGSEWIGPLVGVSAPGSEKHGSGEPAVSPVCGTPVYMAPELFRGEAATARSDIYNLGVVLFHLVTGEYPVEGDYAEVSEAHRQGRRKLLGDARPDLPETFCWAVEKAIEVEPAERYASAGEFGRALATAGGFWQSGWRRRSVQALAGAVAVLAIILGVRLGRGPGPSYDIEAALHRVQAGGGTELLLPGATIAPGDQLLLEFEGSRELFVYVVSHDEKGEAYLLFPMSRSQLKNPVPADARHRLPGTRDGMQLVWTVTSSGGREHMVIIASPKRLEEFEAEIGQLQTPGEAVGAVGGGSGAAGYAAVPEQAILQLRGIGGVARHPLPAAQGRASEIFKEVEMLAARAQSVRGAWVRQIDLEYAEP